MYWFSDYRRQDFIITTSWKRRSDSAKTEIVFLEPVFCNLEFHHVNTISLYNKVPARFDQHLFHHPFIKRLHELGRETCETGISTLGAGVRFVPERLAVDSCIPICKNSLTQSSGEGRYICSLHGDQAGISQIHCFNDNRRS